MRRGLAQAAVRFEAGPQIGGEPYQGAFHIVKQTRPRPGRGAAARDEYIVATGPRVKGRQLPRRLAQTPLGAVAHHRPADPFCRGKTNPHQGRAIGPVSSLGQDGAAGTGMRPGRGQEVWPGLQAFDWGCGFGQAETSLLTA